MSRTARIIPPQGYLHVIARGNNSQRIFLYRRDYRSYLYCLKKLKKEEFVQIHHYCLMPNHVHLLVGVSQKSNLSRFMKRLGLKLFYQYQRRRSYSGHLLQGRFKSKVIGDERYYLQCGKYIELNPVRAGIVNVPEAYPFSSYRHYAFGQKDNVLDGDILYNVLHKDPAQQCRAYQRMIVEKDQCIENLGFSNCNLLLGND